MWAVTAYRLEYGSNPGYPARHPVGSVLELRKHERVNNDMDLLRLARRLFVLETADAARIVIGTSQSRQAYFPELTRDRAAGVVSMMPLLRE